MNKAKARGPLPKSKKADELRVCINGYIGAVLVDVDRDTQRQALEWVADDVKARLDAVPPSIRSRAEP
jgi:hypothetical protein